MYESLKNVFCNLLPNVVISLFNFNEVCLSLLLGCSDCFDCIALCYLQMPFCYLVRHRLLFFKLELCSGLVLHLNSSIYFAKWFCSLFAIFILIKLFLIFTKNAYCFKFSKIIYFIKSFYFLKFIISGFSLSFDIKSSLMTIVY